MMRHGYRKIGKWVLRGVLAVLVLLALNVATLAAPFPLFAHKAAYDEFTIYSDHPLPQDLDRVVDSARARIKAMEHARPGEKCRVFICGDHRLYSLFTFLSRRSSNSLGIGLSAFGNVFLNQRKIQRFAEQNYGGIRHSRFEGDLAETIAHEIAHFNVVKARGFRTAIRMPFWKSEGYAEHQANLAATRTDSAYIFTDRIELLLNDAFWGDNSVARQLFESHLLVEFLVEVNGFGLDELLDESITEASTREHMLTWYQTQQSFN
jgi:hypothetical protein